MKLPRDVTPKLIHVGRREWPSGVPNISPWHRKRMLQNHEIWVFSRGHAKVATNGEFQEVNGGTIFWFRPGQEYEVIQNPQHPIAINFCVLRFVDREGNKVDLPQGPAGLIESVDITLAESVTRRIVELLWEAYQDARDGGEDWEADPCVPKPFFTDETDMTRTSPFVPLLINIFAPVKETATAPMRAATSLFEGLLHEILYQFDRRKRGIVSGLEKHHRDMVSSIALRMQQNPKDISSVSDIALQAGYSTDHFTRTFKKIMGCSPQQFLVNARISKAKAMLLDSGLTIKEIADQLGYCNAYFFSRQFKTMAGHTPSEYRNTFSTEKI